MTTPPCASQPRLFDSTHPADHIVARGICNRCPLLDACRKYLADVQRDATAESRPEGTWAGEFLTGKRNKDALAAEDGRWSDVAARTAHNRWTYHGLRDPVTAEGERVYQRRKSAARRKAVA